MAEIQESTVAGAARESTIIKRAFDQSDGTIEDATDRLFDLVTADKIFIAEHMPAILRTWCGDQIGALVGNIRLKAWTPPNADPGQRQSRLTEAVMSLLDFPLPGGKRLADASRPEVEAGALFYRKQADDMAWKARWLQLIAAKMGDQPNVAAALDAADLAKMQEASRGH